MKEQLHPFGKSTNTGSKKTFFEHRQFSIEVPENLLQELQSINFGALIKRLIDLN